MTRRVSGLTDPDRIRRLLEHRGREGVTQTDFNPPTADGGPPIPQITRRIHDLREKHKCQITTLKQDGFCRYVLTKYVSPQWAEQPVSAPEAAALFDAPVAPPRNAIMDEEQAA